MPDNAFWAYAETKDEFEWATPQLGRSLFKRVPASFFVGAISALEFALMMSLSFIFTRTYVSASARIVDNYMLISLGFSLVILVLFRSNHLYKIELTANFPYTILKIFKIWSIAFLALATVGVLTKLSGQYSRLWIVSWYASGLVVLLGERALAAYLFKVCVRHGFITHSVVVVGATGLAKSFIDRLQNNQYGIKVQAVFDDIMDPHVQHVDGLRVNGDLNALSRYHRTHAIDTVVIAMPMDDPERLRKIVRQLSVYALKIRILPGELAMELPAKWFAPFGEIPGVQLMTISDRPISRSGFFLKALFDRTLALFALIFFGPLMLACVIGIKLSSPGPALFRQRRIGYGNRIFEVYKFRTMRVAGSNTGMLTARNDPRIFKFGEIMRKLSLDELPQIFNVLKGDMSLVGPRPHMPEARAAGQFYYDAVAEYASRHRVKPGITGWAQVNGWRGPTETLEQIEKRVSHDLYYIDNWSLSLDFIIIARTACGGFFGKNAF